MRLKFKIFILLPLLITSTGCSTTDKLSFQSDSHTYDTFYNDSYFLLDNKNVHEEIALASHAMALATFNKNEDFSKRSEYIHNLFLAERFENIHFSDSYFIQPQIDSIAYGIASKYININDSNFTLLAVAVRGGDYEAEWASNVSIGETGNAQGFDQASDKVVQGIKDYISSYMIHGHIKIWIAGYSRGAITTNMTAGKLLESTVNGSYNDENIYFTTDDVYAYCFEPPMGVDKPLSEARSDLYHGIHNFLNYNDMVPLVAPIEWGFVRYGTDHYYSDRLNDIYFDETEREKIISLYHFTYGAQDFADYSVDKWKFFDVGASKATEYNLPREAINPSLGRCLHTFVHELATNAFEDRITYSALVQQGLADIFATINGLNEKIDKISASNIVDLIFEYAFVRTLFLELMESQSAEFAFDVQMLFLQIFGANEENFEAVKELYQENFYLFFLLPQAFLYRKDIAAQILYRDNALGLIIAHMPEVSYSFLCATDSRFLGENKCKFNDGTYKVIHVQNPTSFTIFEKNLNKNIFTYKDGVMQSDHLCAEKLADGTLNIFLPNNGSYDYDGEFESIRLGHVDPLLGETVTTTLTQSNGQIN